MYISSQAHILYMCVWCVCSILWPSTPQYPFFYPFPLVFLRAGYNQRTNLASESLWLPVSLCDVSLFYMFPPWCHLPLWDINQKTLMKGWTDGAARFWTFNLQNSLCIKYPSYSALLLITGRMTQAYYSNLSGKKSRIKVQACLRKQC